MLTRSAPEERRLYDAYSCQRGNERDNFYGNPKKYALQFTKSIACLVLCTGDYGVEAIVNFVNYLTSVTIDFYIA